MQAHEMWKKCFGEAHPEGNDGPWYPGWVHPPSLDTYKGVADWVDPNFFFSKQVDWHNTAIVGMLADFVLRFIDGAILEIGTGVSSIYLTALAKKFNREIYYCDIESCKIINPLSVKGYLAENGHFYVGTSDEMFAKNEIPKLAFTFIDGGHTYEQAKKDFWNAEKLTVENGYILMHDTYPPSADYTTENTCGDVYRFRQEIEKDTRFDCLTFVGSDGYVASTLIRKKPENRPYYQE
jgi:hypothetical protein